MTFKTIEIELPWPPSGNVQTRHTKTGGHYLNPKVAAYRAHVALHLLGLGLGKGRGFNKPLAGPLKLSFIAAPPNLRATDADNRLKCLLDALVHGGLLADDSNKVIKSLAWDWTDPEPNGKIFLTINIGDLT